MELVDKHLPKGGFTLAPVGDIQYGAQGCAEDMLLDHLRRGVKDGWWFLGMGDYLDAASPSSRATLSAARSVVYESTRELIDSAFHDKTAELAKVLAETEGRWAGLVEGDHGWVFTDGQPADALLAAKLKARFLGSSAIVSFHPKGVDRPLRVFVTHGRGASVSSTGKTLHLERLLNAFDVDIVLMGHCHLKYGVSVPRIKTVQTKTGPKLFAENKVVAVTGSFLKGYEENTSSAGWPSGSYVERAAMRPVALGALTIRCEPVKHEWGWEWDLSVTA